MLRDDVVNNALLATVPGFNAVPIAGVYKGQIGGRPIFVYQCQSSPFSVGLHAEHVQTDRG